jgi:hypothetical protein
MTSTGQNLRLKQIRNPPTQQRQQELQKPPQAITHKKRKGREENTVEITFSGGGGPGDMSQLRVP